MGTQERWPRGAGGVGRPARNAPGAIVLVPAALLIALALVGSLIVGDPRPAAPRGPRPAARTVAREHPNEGGAQPDAERSRRTDPRSGTEGPAARGTAPGEGGLTGALQGPLRATVAIIASSAGRFVVGSGMVCSESGTLVTRARLVADADGIVARIFDGRRLTARALLVDRGLDLAVLAVSTDEPLPAVLLGSTAELRPGDAVYALGAATSEGRGSTATRGVLVSLRDGGFLRIERQIETRTFLLHDAALDPEKDGGPLVDEAGRVIGVSTWASRESAGADLAIPVEDVARILSEARDRPVKPVHSP